MGQTLFQKIISNVTDIKNPEEGSIVFVEPHRILTHDNSADIMKKFYSMGAKKVWNPDKIFIALDHAVPPPDEKKAASHKAIREFVEEQKIKHFYDAGFGICHQVLPQEGHVIPGVVILGSDSHTTSHGALGAAGIPMAGLVMISVILTAVGLPLEGVGLILAVDPFLDMCRTSINVWSDSCGAVTIAKTEGETLKV